jgi:hypothetical protein
VLIHALITAIRTRPEPSVSSVLDRFDEKFAHFVGRRLGIAVFAEHHISQLLLVPLLHAILLLNRIFLGFFLLFLLFLISSICVQTSLVDFTLDSQVVRELALPAFVAVTLLVKLAEDSLWIDTERHLLYL